jgi:hypothetical protein
VADTLFNCLTPVAFVLCLGAWWFAPLIYPALAVLAVMIGSLTWTLVHELRRDP